MLPQLFNYEGRQVRAEIKNDEPWFIAKDVCDILEIVNNRDAYFKLDSDEKGVVSTDTPGGKQDMQAVNEYGIYSLVFASRKPEAKAFKRWITHEVIPSIRKTGSYAIQPKPMMLEDVLIAQLQVMKEVKLTQQQQATAIADHEFKISTIDQKVRDEIRLDSREQKQIQGAVNRKAFDIGLPDAYRQIYGALKKHFVIPSYRDLKRSDLTKAFEFIRCWSPRIK